MIRRSPRGGHALLSGSGRGASARWGRMRSCRCVPNGLPSGMERRPRGVVGDGVSRQTRVFRWTSYLGACPENGRFRRLIPRPPSHGCRDSFACLLCGVPALVSWMHWSELLSCGPLLPRPRWCPRVLRRGLGVGVCSRFTLAPCLPTLDPVPGVVREAGALAARFPRCTVTGPSNRAGLNGLLGIVWWDSRMVGEVCRRSGMSEVFPTIYGMMAAGG